MIHYPHLTHEETEAQRGGTCPRPLIVVIFKYIHIIFHTPPFKKWSLPLSMGWT